MALAVLIFSEGFGITKKQASKLEHVKDGKVHKNLVKISRYILLVYTSALASTLGCLGRLAVRVFATSSTAASRRRARGASELRCAP